MQAQKTATAGQRKVSCDVHTYARTREGCLGAIRNSDNKLGTSTSSKRFKEEIKPMEEASEALYALAPITFRYKKDIDPAGTSQVRTCGRGRGKDQSRPGGARQGRKTLQCALRPGERHLLNEFLKEHRKNEKLEATVAALAAQIENISAQTQMSTPAAQVAVNNH
jgi:phage-related protein